MKENYKETHPKEYDLGFEEGYTIYEQGYSREYASTYPELYSDYENQTPKFYAHSFGFFDGYETAEAEDYKIGNELNQEEDE